MRTERNLQRRYCRSWAILVFFVSVAAFMPSTAGAGERSEWCTRMMGIQPRGYLCHFTRSPIVIDGKLDDAAWDMAPWTADFVDIQGPAKGTPRFRTHAKVLWDSDYLYIAAELEEPHVWATLTNHDSVIFQDPDFEVFIDPDGDTHNYYEFEINALNTSWDLRLDKPYQDKGEAHNEWEIPGLKSAVQVRGTLNNSADIDTGWTIELALPWKALTAYARHAGPPKEGEQWRINFSRVEWEISTNRNKYEKVPNRPEDNWVWSPQGIIDMHRPEMWGLLQFTRRAPDEKVAVAPLPGKPARDLALEIYYAQRDFRETHNRWATHLTELGWNEAQLPPGVKKPKLKSTSEGYTCAVGFESHGRRHTWRIRQDRLIELD